MEASSAVRTAVAKEKSVSSVSLGPHPALANSPVRVKVEGLNFVHFDESDVVRHHLVQRIIRAYDEHKSHVSEQQMLLLSGGKHAEARGPAANNTLDSDGRSSASGE